MRGWRIFACVIIRWILQWPFLSFPHIEGEQWWCNAEWALSGRSTLQHAGLEWGWYALLVCKHKSHHFRYGPSVCQTARSHFLQSNVDCFYSTRLRWNRVWSSELYWQSRVHQYRSVMRLWRPGSSLRGEQEHFHGRVVMDYLGDRLHAEHKLNNRSIILLDQVNLYSY
jgi:hypothetical protein